MLIRGHNVWDVQCVRYAGHNWVPEHVNIYDQRCVKCNPYTEAEADRILGK